MKKIDGNDLLINALEKLNINLLSLIAETSIWVSPIYCKELKDKTGSTTRYPNVRRGLKSEKGSIIKGIRIDDNTYANGAIKDAIGIDRKNITNFHACHIYPGSCYNERYHTKLENLVLLPNSIAQLSDNFEDVKKALQYRSFELYGWYPDEMEKPEKPKNYPSSWREPQRYNMPISIEHIREQEIDLSLEAEQKQYFEIEKMEIQKIHKRVPVWIERGHTYINSIILLTFLELLGDNNFVSKQRLMEECSSTVKKFDNNFNQMTQFGPKNHGKVFQTIKDKVTLWEPVAKFIIDTYTNYRKDNP